MERLKILNKILRKRKKIIDDNNKTWEYIEDYHKYELSNTGRIEMLV